MTKKSLHEDIFGSVDGLEEAFSPLKKATGPKKELVSGEMGEEILRDVLGKHHANEIHSRKYHKFLGLDS